MRNKLFFLCFTLILNCTYQKPYEKCQTCFFEYAPDDKSLRISGFEDFPDDDDLRGIKKVEKLFLFDNRFGEIPLVNTLSKVKHLTLKHQELNQFGDNVFPSLISINIQGSNINKIHLSRGSKLQKIQIIDSVIEEDLCMSVLPNIKHLILSENKISCCISSIENLETLRSFFLSGYPIEYELLITIINRNSELSRIHFDSTGLNPTERGQIFSLLEQKNIKYINY